MNFKNYRNYITDIIKNIFFHICDEWYFKLNFVD
jgi:hypothetical protein